MEDVFHGPTKDGIYFKVNYNSITLKKGETMLKYETGTLSQCVDKFRDVLGDQKVRACFAMVSGRK